MRTIFDTTLGDYNVPSNNLNAVTDPGATDDSSKGWSIGSTWINKTGDRTWTATGVGVGAAVWALSGKGQGITQQGAPAALTVSGTLTAAQLLFGILTVNQGAGAASAQQLPLATAMDAGLPSAGVNDAFDFSLINISVTAAEAASITTNTGWTLVGDMDVAANSAITTKSAGRFRARKTGTGAWTLYRLS